MEKKRTWKNVSDKDIQFCIDLCELAVEKLFGYSLCEFYMHNTRSTGGTCWYGNPCMIVLSTSIENCPIDEIMAIVAHEVGHYVAYQESGRNQHHNSYWLDVSQRIAKECGIEPKMISRLMGNDWEATKNLNNKQQAIESKPKKKYAVMCECCGQSYEYTNKYYAIKVATNHYQCGVCGSNELSYIGEIL